MGIDPLARNLAKRDQDGSGGTERTGYDARRVEWVGSRRFEKQEWTFWVSLEMSDSSKTPTTVRHAHALGSGRFDLGEIPGFMWAARPLLGKFIQPVISSPDDNTSNAQYGLVLPVWGLVLPASCSWPLCEEPS